MIEASNIGRAACGMSPRLTFPTVTANQSVLQILPRFVEVMGQKIDKITAEKDRIYASNLFGSNYRTG